jgi:hypothetical protein
LDHDDDTGRAILFRHEFARGFLHGSLGTRQMVMETTGRISSRNGNDPGERAERDGDLD